MRTRARNPFTTVTTAGLLLPIDLLTRIVDGDPNLPGLSPKDYHLRSSERLNEAASRAWNECLAAWKTFRKKFAALPASDAGTTLTRDEWLLPLFQELGYGRLQPKRAVEIDSREYPISHGWENHVPIHLLSARYPIDRRTPGTAGAATRAPYSLLQELLNRSGQYRWGFVSNGLKLYLLHDNAALARAANVEFDLEAMMDGELYADFMLLFLLCHQSRVEIQPTPIAKVTLDRKTGKAKKAKVTSQKKLATDDDSEIADGEETAEDEEEKLRLGPENCWLERWANQADQQGTRARDKLRDGVEAAIKALGAGFLTTKGNQRLRERMRTGDLSTQDYYRQLLRVVYRLLMLLVAEEKKTENGANLFHPPGTAPLVCERYARFYSVSRIRALAYERRGTAHTDLYDSLKVLFLKLREGYAPLGIPGMGSFLFSDDSTPDLDELLLSNQDLLDAFRQLCYTEDMSGRGGSIRRPVDFGNLGSDELGSVYESLLELHPKIETDEGPFTLGTASGNERKTTGSYYTPTSLINCLLDSGLDPVVHAAIDVPDRAEAERKLLNLKVCDPACGSGHFLIAAAERMAMHLARLRTGDDEPNTLDIQHAKRDIIGRCIYGVDINPMAVELCKVALWMEAMEPGKPFSYLDHHIQCGNSLLGTTPALLDRGIPDDAFTAIEGDVKSRVSELKKQNKKERLDRINRQTGLFEPPLKLGNLSAEFVRLNILEDGSLNDIHSIEERYTALVRGTNYQNARLLADTWCAAFVWKKDDSDLGKMCPTERDFRKVESHAAAGMLPHVRTEVERLRDQYQFFHWHLAFPDVFQLPGKDEPSGSENEQTGWTGGFDCLLGNPPWEKLKLEEQEWFAERRPGIASAPGAKRKTMIAALEYTEPSLFLAYLESLRRAEGLSHCYRDSGLFPLCSQGDINSFAVFVELMTERMNAHGRTACIVPSGIATDNTTKYFLQKLLRDHMLSTFYDFWNRRQLFKGVQAKLKFCLISISGTPVATIEIAAQLEDPAQLRDRKLVYEVTADEIIRINPNTQNLPTFETADAARLTIALHVLHSVLVLESGTAIENPHGIEFYTLFHSTNDSDKFFTHDELAEKGACLVENHFVVDEKTYVPIFEAKLVHQFNHRASTFPRASTSEMFKIHAGTTSLDATSLQQPFNSVIPRYWMSRDVASARRIEKTNKNWLVGFRRTISAVADSRSVVFTVLPPIATTDSMFMVDFESGVQSACLLLGVFNSFCFDFVARQKASGGNLSFYVFKQLPVPAPAELTPHLSFVLPRVLELTYTAWDLEPFARDCGYHGPPFRWDEERRFLLRAELDAAFFHLYLPSDANGDWRAANESPEDLARLKESFPKPRDAVSYIMDTFPIVHRKDIAKHGTYLTKDTILKTYDAMLEAIRTGVPHQTTLNPPPGPPADAEGQFIPFAKWNSSLKTSHIHPPREATSEKPQTIVVDPAFPKTDLEKVLCSCLLDFVTSKPGLAEDQYVDLMILAMQPANCRMLLTGDNRNRFDQSLKTVLPALIADSDGKPPWRLLLRTLQANQSIQGADGKFFTGPTAELVRGKLLEVDSQFLAMVLKAGERLRELQEAATPDPALARVVRDMQNHRAAAKVGATSA